MEHTALPFTINTGIVKLIYKKGDRQSIANWRPITMLTTAYKIFAKALANRITGRLHSWLQSNQKGFVKGRRHILDVVIALWEGIKYAQESK